MDEAASEITKPVEGIGDVKAFENMSLLEQKEALEKAIEVLDSKNLREGLEDRGTVEKANDLLNIVAEIQKDRWVEYRVELDPNRKAEDLKRVTDTDFFRSLEEKTKSRAAEVGLAVDEARRVMDETEDAFGVPLSVEARESFESSEQRRRIAVESYMSWLRQMTASGTEEMEFAVDREKSKTEGDAVVSDDLLAQARELRARNAERVSFATT